MSWLHDKTTEFLDKVEDAKRQKAFPFFRPMENIGTQVKVGRGSYINFTSNDYLGLSQHPALKRAAKRAVDEYGTGLGSSRLQATSVRHELLEQRLAAWLGYEACAVFTTGYQALVGVISTFLDDESTVIIDRLSHASIIDGVLLAQGQNPDLELRFLKHNSAKRLRKILSTTDRKKKMVIVEGLYSVDGDLAPLDDLVAVCRELDTPIVVDDAHGLGALGATGRGVGEIHGVLDQIDIMIGTFSKCFGGVGGFVCGDRELIDFLKLHAKSFVFSASLPVSQVEAALVALDIIESDLSYLRRLDENKCFFREGLLQLGFDLGDSDTHITPIMVNDEVKALTFGAYLYHGAGVIMLPFISPGVDKGKERLRCNVTAGHTKAQMGYSLEALAAIGQQLDILPKGAKTRATNAQRLRWTAETKLRGLRNAGLGFVAEELSRTKVGEWTRRLLNGHNE